MPVQYMGFYGVYSMPIRLAQAVSFLASYTSQFDVKILELLGYPAGL